MSKKLFAMLLVGLLSASVSACGPDDTPVDTPDTDVETDAGDDTDVDTNEPHPFEDEVDVWLGNTANDIDTPEAIEVGQTIGGQLDGAAQFYELTLEAGTALKVTVEALDGTLGDENAFGVTLRTMADESNRALFYAADAASREFFIYAEGSHLLVPTTGEEFSGAYKITTEVVELDPQEPTIPGVTAGDMSDGSIQVYEVVADIDGTLAAETSAQRLAPEGGVDTFLHVWDVAAAARIAQNDDFDSGAGHYDSRVFAEVTSGNTYYVIVDAYSNDADGLFELTMETFAGGSADPVVVADGAEESGTIEARLVGVDIKAYSLTVEPGQNFRVLVEADDALTPAIVAVAGPAGEEQQAGSAQPVEGRAGMYVGVGANEEEAQTFTLYVSDERNLTEGAEPVGGEDFGYTLSVEAVSRNAVSLEASTSSAQVLADVGQVTWFDVVVPARTIVSLAVETEVAEDDFAPLVVSADFWTFSPFFGAEAVLYNDADEAVTMPVLVRDGSFRGGATTTYTLNATFVDATLPTGATTYTFTEQLLTSADAEVIELPAQVFGLLDSEAAEAIEEGAVPTQFFSIDLVAGDVLVARTTRGTEPPANEEEEDASTNDTVLRLFEGDGTTQILEADYYVGQSEETYYSAFTYVVEEDGTYFLSVQPYCQSFLGMNFCSDGEYRLDVFTAAE